MPLFTDMAERHDFLSLVLRVLMGAVLCGGLMADAAEKEVRKAVAETNSPTEIYKRQVIKLVEEKWYLYRSQRPDGVRAGSLQAEFYVNKQGRVEGLRVVNGQESNLILTGMTLRAIRDVVLPPMPDEVISALPMNEQGRLKIACNAVVLPVKPVVEVEGLHLTEPKGGAALSHDPAAVRSARMHPAPAKEGESESAAIPKALPVLDDVPGTRTTPNQGPNAFTRTAQTKERSEAAADAENTPKGRYIRQVLGAVEKKWHLYCKLRRDGMTYGHIQVAFYVNKKGKVEDFRIVDDKESNPVLTGITKQAIFDAEIPPIPADVISMLPKDSPERLKIESNVLIY